MPIAHITSSRRKIASWKTIVLQYLYGIAKRDSFFCQHRWSLILLYCNLCGVCTSWPGATRNFKVSKYKYARTLGFARNWSLTVRFRTFWLSGHDLFLSNSITLCGDRASRDVIFFDQNDKFDNLLRGSCFRGCYVLRSKFKFNDLVRWLCCF